ncbi:hypothetical protein AAHB34_07415 [Paenarthrobacter ureafaciens]
MKTCRPPGALLADLFFTGYYPVCQWISYLLLGLLIGRLALSKQRVQVLLLAVGTALAIVSKVLGNPGHGSLGVGGLP